MEIQQKDMNNSAAIVAEVWYSLAKWEEVTNFLIKDNTGVRIVSAAVQKTQKAQTHVVQSGVFVLLVLGIRALCFVEGMAHSPKREQEYFLYTKCTWLCAWGTAN